MDFLVVCIYNIVLVLFSWHYNKIHCKCTSGRLKKEHSAPLMILDWNWIYENQCFISATYDLELANWATEMIIGYITHFLLLSSCHLNEANHSLNLYKNCLVMSAKLIQSFSFSFKFYLIRIIHKRKVISQFAKQRSLSMDFKD